MSESTGLTDERLIVLVLLITFAYVVGVAARRVATFQGDTIQKRLEMLGFEQFQRAENLA